MEREVIKIDITTEEIMVNSELNHYLEEATVNSELNYCVEEGNKCLRECNNTPLKTKCYDIIKFKHSQKGVIFKAVCKNDWKEALPIIKYWEQHYNAMNEEMNKLQDVVGNYADLQNRWYVKLGQKIERIWKCLTIKIN